MIVTTGHQRVNETSWQLFGVRRLDAALADRDLWQPEVIKLLEDRRQAALDQSGVEPPHSKELGFRHYQDSLC